jgi:1D-myo-inositol 3-kinase
MPRLLAVGHVTWDRLQGQDVLGGSVTYAARAARRLGWEAAILTSAGPDFDASRDLRDVEVFVQTAAATTRFENDYDADGIRRQTLRGRAADIDLAGLPQAWRRPDVLLLCPVAGELHGPLATALEAEVVGATAQGWLRRFDEDGSVLERDWLSPGIDLEGVHFLCFSEQDVEDPDERARRFLEYVPIVLLTRGWRGLTLLDRQGAREIPAHPVAEEDPTGAGDVFTAAFLMRYQETGDPETAAAFGSCAASCAVEGIGTSRLGDRAEVERRLERRERFLEGEDEE